MHDPHEAQAFAAMPAKRQRVHIIDQHAVNDPPKRTRRLPDPRQVTMDDIAPWLDLVTP